MSSLTSFSAGMEVWGSPLVSNLLYPWVPNKKQHTLVTLSITGVPLGMALPAYPITAHHSNAFSTAWGGFAVWRLDKQTEQKMLYSNSYAFVCVHEVSVGFGGFKNKQTNKRSEQLGRINGVAAHPN